MNIFRKDKDFGIWSAILLLLLVILIVETAKASDQDNCWNGTWEIVGEHGVPTNEGWDIKVISAPFLGRGILSARWYTYSPYNPTWHEVEGITYALPELEHKFAEGVLLRYTRTSAIGQPEVQETEAAGTVDIYPSSLHPGYLRVKWDKRGYVGVDGKLCEGTCFGEFLLARLTKKECK